MDISINEASKHKFKITNQTIPMPPEKMSSILMQAIYKRTRPFNTFKSTLGHNIVKLTTSIYISIEFSLTPRKENLHVQTGVFSVAWWKNSNMPHVPCSLVALTPLYNVLKMRFVSFKMLIIENLWNEHIKYVHHRVYMH